MGGGEEGENGEGVVDFGSTSMFQDPITSFLEPFPPWTYSSKIAGVCPRRFIGDQSSLAR